MGPNAFQTGVGIKLQIAMTGAISFRMLSLFEIYCLVDWGQLGQILAVWSALCQWFPKLESTFSTAYAFQIPPFPEFRQLSQSAMCRQGRHYFIRIICSDLREELQVRPHNSNDAGPGLMRGCGLWVRTDQSGENIGTKRPPTAPARSRIYVPCLGGGGGSQRCLRKYLAMFSKFPQRFLGADVAYKGI